MRREVKRVLWVDDRPETEARELFVIDETKQVGLMIEAIDEISSNHLYDYDTIVFDINFENGITVPEEIVEKLSREIYLNLNDNIRESLINMGGYLLCIYLLERGYPVNQVAFLTGHTGMMDGLKAYCTTDEVKLTKEEIVAEYHKAWNDAGDGDDAEDIFIRKIKSLPVSEEYFAHNTIEYCERLLESHKDEELRNYINKIVTKPITNIYEKNTSDKVMYRFHEANLKAPQFFTKKEYYIRGHDIDDAKRWLNEGRTEDRLARWLVMYAGHHIKSLFEEDYNDMMAQVTQLFSNMNTDAGIQSAFSQLYNLFYGLRDIEEREPYYQAIAAMLMPFGNSLRHVDYNASSAGDNYVKVQRAFAKFSRQARNYCAHCYFGSSVSNKTALFIIMGALSSVLSKNQRHDLDDIWYKKAGNIVSTGAEYSVVDNIRKIKDLCETLLSAGNIDLSRVFRRRSPNSYAEYSPVDVMTALGWNCEMDPLNEQDTSVREAYFAFTLAAFIVKWFEGLSEEEIRNRYGEGIRVIFQLSNEIVAEYNYPYSSYSVPADELV